MKIVIEYNLPDDAYEYNKARNATAYMLCLQDIDEWLKNQIKYADDVMSDEAYDALEMVRNKLHAIMTENNANLYPSEDI